MVIREISLPLRNYLITREDTFFRTKTSNSSKSKNSKTATLGNPKEGRNPSLEKKWTTLSPKNPTQKMKQNYLISVKFKKLVLNKQSKILSRIE